MESRSSFPVRFSQEQIDANRNQIKAYVVLPIPKHANNVPFETIGRTTFKKYILHSYGNLFSQGSLKTNDFNNIPFVITEKPTIAHVVYVENTTLSQKSQQQQHPRQKSQQQSSVQSQSQAHGKPSTSQSNQIQSKSQPTQVNKMADFSLETDDSYYAPSHSKLYINK